MRIKVLFIVLFAGVLISTKVLPQTPELGAQVWIEPGNTDEEIDSWFRMLAEQEMPVARFFIMWNYIENKPGDWDFTLYDKAFDAAAKHGVKVVATLTTNRRAAHRGDFYQLHGHELEGTEERLEESSIYIQKIVGHWKNHPALDSWILTNEASQWAHEQPLAMKRYRVWLKDKYKTIENLNEVWSAAFDDFDEIEYTDKWTSRGYWNWKILHMDWTEFWRNHLTWWLNWIADEVRKVDPNANIHVHSGNVTGNQAAGSYDFPSWRDIGTTLGTSCHTSWAFGVFERDQFALGMSYVSDLFAGSSQELPYWITELQGGTNQYSGGQWPMTPSTEDIAQWVWTGIGNGANRVIFWMLNWRLKSFETTEWSMLDFNNKPTDRLEVSGDIAKKINEYSDFFDGATPVKAPITILLSLESMSSENWSARTDYEGRGSYGHLKSVYGYYETLTELGIPVNLRHMHDFNWDTKETGQMVILPHTTVITSDQVKGLNKFVGNGNTVLMTGLSGLTNENTEAWVFQGFPFQEFLGANLKEYRWIDNVFKVDLQEPALSIPAHLWEGDIENISARVIGSHDGRITGIVNNYKKGKAIWIPSLLGLGAWLDDNEPLANLLLDITKTETENMPFRFPGYQEGCVMRILQKGEQYVTIVTNGNLEPNSCYIEMKKEMSPEVLWGDANNLSDKEINLGPLETSVILWK